MKIASWRVLLLAIVAVGGFAGAAAAQTAAVQITGAWARATPGKAANGAAYLTIESPVPDQLTGVSSPVAGKAELHRMTMEGAIMKMRPVDHIDLPAGEPVTLKPGGLHIMLVGLKQPLRRGQSFPLTLDLAKAGKREVSVTVEGVGAMGPNAADSGGMTMPMPAHH